MADIVYLESLGECLPLKGASCAFGVFDGVHMGHAFLIDQAKSRALEDGVPSAVLTFDRDPDELFHAERLHKLLENEARLEKLAATGVDTVAVLRFTRDFASLDPEVFLATTFERQLPTSIHVGHDIRFGNKASGTLKLLGEWGRAHGVDVIGYDLLEYAGAPITATRIRLLLEEGKTNEARTLLGY